MLIRRSGEGVGRIRGRRASGALLVAAIGLCALAWETRHPVRARAGALDVHVEDSVRERVARGGRARVIVELRLPAGPATPEGHLQGQAAARAQRGDILSSQSQVLSRLGGRRHRVLHRYQTVPYLALEVEVDALAELQASGLHVRRVVRDTLKAPILSNSVPLIEGDQAWTAGHDGTGTVVAILDTGVESIHPFLAGRVVEEACFSSDVSQLSTSVCPSGLEQQIGPGAAAPCGFGACWHGTHVAGIAAGDGAGAAVVYAGVAKGAGIMAVQVFSRFDDNESCDDHPPCVLAWTSDIIAGLERVYSLRDQHTFAAVNLSLGGDVFAAACDGEAEKPIIDNLRSVGIATVIAAGNDGARSGLSSPACISSAISVGSTTKSDTVSSSSNVAPFMSLFAPGSSIVSSYPGGGWATAGGTSMATPHVAGAFAVLKQAAPAAPVVDLLTALQQTGLPITDTRSDGTVTRPRIRILQGLQALTGSSNPAPALSAIQPTGVTAGAPGFTLTVTGSDFIASSVVRWNGSSRPTTFVNSGQLRATIAAGDLATHGSAAVTVFTPPIGGGTSSSRSFVISAVCPASIVVDNLAPKKSSAQVSSTGTWKTATRARFFGVNQSLVSNGAGPDTYTWKTPQLNPQQACTYQVFVWWTSASARSKTVPYVVSGQTGAAATMIFNQRVGGGQWNLHGTYTFPAGSVGTVSVSDLNGQASADAVRFLRVP